MSSTHMSFEQPDAWTLARSVTRSIYRITRTGRLARDYGLGNQAQRAGVSIMSNVAEGYERCHMAENLQFYNVAAGSTAEVRSLTYVIEDNYPEVAADAIALRDEAHRTSKVLAGLIRSTEARRAPKAFCCFLQGLLAAFGI